MVSLAVCRRRSHFGRMPFSLELIHGFQFQCIFYYHTNGPPIKQIHFECLTTFICISQISF